ncbi:MAG: hypothetical protein ACRD5W_04725 [Candidatus Acidiferrales bacterium]
MDQQETGAAEDSGQAGSSATRCRAAERAASGCGGTKNEHD